MQLSASKSFAALVVFGWASALQLLLPAGEGSLEKNPADFSELYGRISRGGVGITRRDYPRARPRSTITHFGTGTLLDPVGLVLTSLSGIGKRRR